VNRWAVILAGGVGSRFWPLSTPERPKQLLALAGSEPLLAEAVRRLTPLVPPERTLVITNRTLAPAVSSLLSDVPEENVIAEPRSAGTAPALAWAAAEIQRRADAGAVMLSVHADWAVGDPEGFRSTLACAAEVAERQKGLVTVGIVPTRPDPGFGYIQPGEQVDGARRAARFVEKPDRTTAERMVRDGYLWNSGIFVWRVGDFLAEVAAHSPEVASALPKAEAGDIEAFFGAVTPISVDHGVLERSARVFVLPGDFEWDDVGTWAALRRVRRLDADGNAAAGDTHLVHASGNVVHTEGQTVVLYGVNDLVVVSRDGLTLVTSVDRAADLKTLLDALPPSVRDRR
jgi:mannose-1-phosphate guanylyltransferase